MIKAVIFDLDGTLLNTLDDLASAVNFALEECRFPLRTTEEVQNFVGNGVKVLIKRAVPSGTNDEDYQHCFELFSAYYLEHMFDQTRAYLGILTLLEKLKEQGFQTAVVSNKLHDAVVRLCKCFFDSLICEAYGVSEESQRKPSPENVFRALDAFGLQKNEVLYVGDSNVDAETAEAAGLSSIGVSWGFRDKADLLQLSFSSVVDSTDELFEKIISFDA